MTKKKSRASNYVMYGFKKSDIDVVGYLRDIPVTVDEDFLTDDIKLAKRFPDKNIKHVKGFGTPQQWLEYVNQEFDDLFGKRDAFKFHLVKTTL